MSGGSVDADLSEEEIARITKGLKQKAAKVRFLQALGLTVRRKPDGSPLVNRKHYDAVMNPGEPSVKSPGIRWREPA